MGGDGSATPFLRGSVGEAQAKSVGLETRAVVQYWYKNNQPEGLRVRMGGIAVIMNSDWNVYHALMLISLVFRSHSIKEGSQNATVVAGEPTLSEGVFSGSSSLPYWRNWKQYSEGEPTDIQYI